MAYQFGQLGSNPALSIMTGSNSNPLGIGTTPQSKALNNAVGGASTPAYMGKVTTPGTNYGTVNGQQITGNSTTTNTGYQPQFSATNPGLIPPTKQDVKSHTTADGTTQTYYPSADNKVSSSTTTATPVKPIADTTQTKPVDTTGGFNGLINAGTQASGSSYNQGTGNVNTGTQMTSNAVNNPNPNIAQAQSGLLGIAQNQTPEVKNAQSEFNQFSKANPYLTNDIAFNPNVAGFLAAGQGQAYGANAAAEQAALGQNVQNALQGQGQQITAGTAGGGQALTQQGNAITGGTNIANTGTTQQSTGISGLGTSAGLIKPQAGANYFGSPTTGGIVGQGNDLISNGVNIAVNKALAGGDATAIRNDLISQFGAPAGIAFDTAYSQGGSYNPTAQSAGAQTNAAIGAQYQKQASDLGASLAQLDNAGAQAQAFLEGHPQLNSTNTPVGNAAIQSYLQQVGDTAAVTNYNTILADVQKFQSAITASGSGLTPTQQTSNILSQDPSKLSAPQLASYIQTLKQLGQSQQAVFQGQTSAAYSAKTPYSGTPTSVNTNNVSTPGGGNANLKVNGQQAGQITEGAGIGLLGKATDMVTNLGPEIVGWLAKTIAG